MKKHCLFNFICIFVFEFVSLFYFVDVLTVSYINKTQVKMPAHNVHLQIDIYI